MTTIQTPRVIPIPADYAEILARVYRPELSKMEQGDITYTWGLLCNWDSPQLSDHMSIIGLSSLGHASCVCTVPMEEFIKQMDFIADTWVQVPASFLDD